MRPNNRLTTRFGKPIRTITDPGLHFKIPFVETAHIFDKRFLEWRGDPSQVTTEDKRYIWVDTYARWHITDPLLLYKRLRDETGAMSRLDDIIDGETRTTIASHLLIELVRTTNRDATVDPILDLDSNQLESIEYGRRGISKKILSSSAERVKDLGVEILDFRIKRLNYVDEVQATVFERMITERKRIADQYRSEGQGEASRISGERQRELNRIQSEAKRTAQEIKGRADAKAAAIYSEAYNRNSASREFYAFTKTMETYEETLDSTTSLILSTESDFYKYLKRLQPE
ncbi:MAG: protease modulator HflC [Candidatus Marinimicrobia bacterium]|nr:protease modulator HflC [Candidatus Neomarinimicrobiota bacterium]